MGEVSDVVGDDTTVVDDNTSNDDNDDTATTKGGDDAVFFRAARDIMNRVGRKVGTAAREDRRFREHFGAPFAIVRMVCGGGAAPQEGRAKASVLDTFFVEVLPKGGPRLRRRRSIKGCHRPQDDAQVGVALPQAHQ